ncbi:MAG: Asp/Glu racemase [Proteobacteria bacterium]|nr:Asp/Glu racemase [Pseudomonadota bacterium]
MTTIAEPQETWIGARGRIGVVIPSTNTAVEYDCQQIRIPGVTWHFSRFIVELPNLSDDDRFVKFLEAIRPHVGRAADDLMTAEMTHIMMGMSAETFWGGIKGNADFLDSLMKRIGGLGLTTGANAMVDALNRFGAKRLAVLTPYQPIGDQQVRNFFGQSGFEVVRLKGLRCATATSIAHTPRGRVASIVLDELEGDDVDAIIQVGTNLSTAEQFPTLEQMLGKPCIPINVATAWHALRSIGVNDRVCGRGRLFDEF